MAGGVRGARGDHKQPWQTSGEAALEEEEEEDVGRHGLSSVYPPPQTPLSLLCTFAVCRSSGEGGGGGGLREEARPAVEIPPKTFRGCSHSTLREPAREAPHNTPVSLPPSQNGPLSSALS